MGEYLLDELCKDAGCNIDEFRASVEFAQKTMDAHEGESWASIMREVMAEKDLNLFQMLVIGMIFGRSIQLDLDMDKEEHSIIDISQN